MLCWGPLTIGPKRSPSSSLLPHISTLRRRRRRSPASSPPSDDHPPSVAGFSIGLQVDQSSSMGRKAGSLYINPKKFGAIKKPCMQEMLSFLNCLALNQNKDERCVRQIEKLNACVNAQAGKNRKPWGSINYHLQRLSRGR